MSIFASCIRISQTTQTTTVIHKKEALFCPDDRLLICVHKWLGDIQRYTEEIGQWFCLNRILELLQEFARFDYKEETFCGVKDLAIGFNETNFPKKIKKCMYIINTLMDSV